MTGKSETTLQANFLNRIKIILGPDKSLVYELAELLGVSTDSIYRRLRGETLLTIDEIALLCKRFNISFDILSGNTSGLVTFQFSLLKDVEGYLAHWNYMLNDMKQIAAAEKKQVIYAAVDIPLFHHFKFPELATFKLFYWMKEVMNEPSLKDKSFNPDWLIPELLQISKEIYSTYCEIPAIEIWTESTVNSMLKQIEYYWETGQFASKELALLIVDKAIDEIETIIKQAENCSKTDKPSDPGSEKLNFQIYQSDIEIGNNCVYTIRDNFSAVYMGFLTFNTMATNNEIYCRETEVWLTNITKKSTLISGIAQKQRYQFFRKIIQRYEALKLNISGSAQLS